MLKIGDIVVVRKTSEWYREYNCFIYKISRLNDDEVKVDVLEIRLNIFEDAEEDHSDVSIGDDHGFYKKDLKIYRPLNIKKIISNLNKLKRKLKR